MKNRPKILVTGGMGYIGTHTVVSLWENGYEPIIIDNFSNSSPRMIHQLNKLTRRFNTIYKIDCASKYLRRVFEKHVIEGIIHFAAFKSVNESIDNPIKYYDNNMNALFNIVSLAREFEVANLVFSSSCTVYGIPDVFPVNEQSLLKDSTSPYGHTKQLAEDVLYNESQDDIGLNIISLRYFNPVGAHKSGLIGENPVNTPTNLLPVLTEKVYNNECFIINGGSYDTKDGTCVRDFIHVLDLADAHIKAIDFLKSTKRLKVYENINIGTGQGTSVFEIVTILQSIKPNQVNYTFGPKREGDIPSIYACTKKAETLLGWKAKYTIEEAVADHWNWMSYYKMFMDDESLFRA